MEAFFALSSTIALLSMLICAIIAITMSQIRRKMFFNSLYSLIASVVMFIGFGIVHENSTSNDTITKNTTQIQHNRSEEKVVTNKEELELETEYKAIKMGAELAKTVIRKDHGENYCNKVTDAYWFDDGSLLVECDNAEKYRVGTIGDRLFALKCSAAEEFGMQDACNSN